jgi:hypothetical protein
LLNENTRLREALADIARGDYSDPLCQRTPEQRAREALAERAEAIVEQLHGYLLLATIEQAEL